MSEEWRQFTFLVAVLTGRLNERQAQILEILQEERRVPRRRILAQREFANGFTWWPKSLHLYGGRKRGGGLDEGVSRWSSEADERIAVVTQALPCLSP